MRSVLSGFVVCALAASAFAGGATDPVIWDNFPSGNGGNLSSSQLDTVYPFDSQVADDFTLANQGSVGDMSVTGVEWVGGWFGGAPIAPAEFNIMFYADAGGLPTGGPTDPTGTALSAQTVVAGEFSVVPNPNGDGTELYSVDLPVAFTAAAADTFWVAIQHTNVFPPQWGISDSLDSNGSSPVSGFPFLGINYWTPTGGADTAFRLTGVPEPASALFAFTGALALVRRRRRS